jgi:hypothetical protein
MAKQAEQYDSESRGKYGTFKTGSGDVVIYDRDSPTAWLQSDTVLTLR